MQRIFDVLFSLIGIIFLLPLFICVIIILSLTGERKVFFKQSRVGKDRKVINILKFVTMLENSPNIGTGLHTKKNGLLLNWQEFEKLDHAQKINTLAMIAPVTNEEKQKLLEAVSIKNKVETLESIISFYLHETGLNNQTIQ